MAAARQRLAPLKKLSNELEIEIQNNQTHLKKIDAELALADLFTKAPDKAVKLGQSRAQISKQIEILEIKWLEVLETYENAKKVEGLD